MGKTKNLTVKGDELISVIIAFFNVEKFLKEAIESVFAQDYSNWEMMLIDDGSTDASSEIAQHYAKKYPKKVYYLDHENHANIGVTASRNLGLSKCNGSLIAILDSDDVWLPGKLTQQVKLMVNNPKAAMICESSLYWRSWQGNKEYEDLVVQTGHRQDRLFAPLSLCYELYPLSDGAAPCPSGLLIRHDVLIKYGGFEASFNGIYQMYEDQALLQKIYLEEYVYVSSMCNNKYRQRIGSLVQKTTADGDYNKARQFFLAWLKNYIAGRQIGNAKLDRRIDNAIRNVSEDKFQKLKTAWRNISARIMKLNADNIPKSEKPLKQDEKKMHA